MRQRSRSRARAFQAGWLLSRTPHLFDDEQRTALSAACGAERAIDVIWKVAWGNYMTLVADSLRLPLERENAFRRPTPAATDAPKK